MQEIEVIRATRRFLKKHGLLGVSVLEPLFTDAHPSLLGATDLRPFQRFTLAFDGFAVHPDLVGRLADGESLVAIEAKGTSDFLRGIAQAELYRRGFHVVLLACAGRPPQELLILARQRSVGVLAVFPDQVEVLYLPPAHLPQLRHAERIRRQFAVNVALISPFYFNLPTHYLAMVPVLWAWEQERSDFWASLRDLAPMARACYPVLPQTDASLRGALRGAAKLGLVELQADRARLTFTGRTVTALLPTASNLAQIHTQLVTGSRRETLAMLHPQAGAVLRLLITTDPIAQLLIDTLQVAGSPLSMLYGPSIYLLHPDEVKQIFDGVTIDVYQAIERLYVDRLGRSITTVMRVMDSMAAQAAVPSLDPTATWAIALYLDRLHHDEVEVSFESSSAAGRLLASNLPSR